MADLLLEEVVSDTVQEIDRLAVNVCGCMWHLFAENDDVSIVRTALVFADLKPANFFKH